jgi:hypothetical protein
MLMPCVGGTVRPFIVQLSLARQLMEEVLNNENNTLYHTAWRDAMEH